ncbi:MAG: glutathione S-transferase family protein [Candidatus Lambdaproteobacteria bacterium]|nr:glutathione S-transferase family protein [Candidatus Lambdaproteobacteria bacterium]
MSPYGKVPALVDGEQVVFESAIIGEYLDEAYPEPPLMPKEPYARAQARLWSDYVGNHLGPALRNIRYAKTPEEGASHVPALHERLAYVESHIRNATGGWFVGGRFGMADINFLPHVHRIAGMEGAPLAKYPGLHAWYAAFRKRPSFQETLDGR